MPRLPVPANRSSARLSQVLLDCQNVKDRRPYPLGGGTDTRNRCAFQPPPPGLSSPYTHGSDNSKLYKVRLLRTRIQKASFDKN